MLPLKPRLAASLVMAGLVPAIHVFAAPETKTWMPGTRPGVTKENK
jgi:hypothetical protein